MRDRGAHSILSMGRVGGAMPRTRPTPASRYGPIIDAHTHPMLPGEAPILGAPHSAEEYLRVAKGLDLRYAAAFVMAPLGDLPRTRSLNNKVLALSQPKSSKFLPVCSVHPGDGTEALLELDRVAKMGARGVKLHPNTQQFDVGDANVAAVVGRAAEHRLPVVFDGWSPFDANQPGKFVRLAMAVPDARLILAHAHGPQFPNLLVYEVLARYPWWRRNVWIDLSATAPLLARGPFAEQFAWVCRKVGVDRLLFGSDYPMDEPKSALEAVATYGFSKPELSAIFYNNAAQLFGLTPL
jgi:predicted TIM-barrel fold metal-dependent hydrolase